MAQDKYSKLESTMRRADTDRGIAEACEKRRAYLDAKNYYGSATANYETAKVLALDLKMPEEYEHAKIGQSECSAKVPQMQAKFKEVKSSNPGLKQLQGFKKYRESDDTLTK